ncbi:MAG: thioesterase domain-containing protein, partial [Bacteroidota bacterium]
KEIPSVKLSEYLRDCLPPYMLPSYFVRLDRLPLSSSDKLNERALPDPTFETTDNYLAPSSQLEYQLVGIWSKVLNIEADKISVDRSFFEMGGHSLRAIQLVSAIREELRFELPLVDIFKYPTIKAQAGRIPDGQDKRLQNNEILTLLRRTDRGRDNLFFVHDGSGDIQAYMELVAGLEDFSCWGLRSPSLSRLGPQQPSLPEMARCYIDQIKGVQSEGPYTLLGWSLGGNIVFEMARQLEASGELVRQIVMIDTPFPFRDQTSSVAVEQSFNLQTEKLFISQFLGVDVSIFSPKESIAGLWQKALHLFGEQELNLEAVKAKIPQEIRFMIPHFDSLTIAQLAASVNTIRTLETAVASYNTVAKVDVPLLYIKASQSDLNLNGLPGHFRQKAIIEELQGDHFSILQAPVVDELQAIIHQRMGLALITT